MVLWTLECSNDGVASKSFEMIAVPGIVETVLQEIGIHSSPDQFSPVDGAGKRRKIQD